MNQQPPLDLFSLIVALIGSAIGQQLAPYAGAYLVILFAWFGGLQVGLYRRDPKSRMSTASFVTVTLIMTLGATTVAATWLAPKVSADSTALLFPVAFMIPAVGDSWVAIVKWAIDTYKAARQGGREQ
jgi:hypothetical protein